MTTSLTRTVKVRIDGMPPGLRAPLGNLLYERTTGQEKRDLPDMVTERLVIQGSLDALDFPDWIIHRARRLGLKGGIVSIGAGAIETLVAGPPELIDAMEVGCSLGPISVEVEHIDRSSVEADVADGPFSYVGSDHAGIEDRPVRP